MLTNALSMDAKQCRQPPNNPCPAGRDCSGGCRGDCFASIERAFVSTVHPSSVAAIIVEPVSGEGGFIPFPDFYLRRLQELCDEHGIVMIVDEVQTGFGRTGKMFAIEHSGVEPDIITTAKSMGGGLPIAGVTGRRRSWTPSTSGASAPPTAATP